MNFISIFVSSFIDMFIDMAFYIMIGLFFVGILNTYVKRDKILKHLGTEKFSSVVKASIVGVPLPLCSCGVVPTALELKRSGASNGAVISFLMSTPQTGVDSMIATYSMMGGVMAIFRPIAAFLSGIFGGAMVNLFAKDEVIQVDSPIPSCCCEGETSESSCCSSGIEVVSSCGCETKATESSCCCDSTVEVSSCGCETKVEESACCCDSTAGVSSCGCETTEKESSCGCGTNVEVSSCGCETNAKESACCCETNVEVSSCGCETNANESSCGCGTNVEVSSCGCSTSSSPTTTQNKFLKALHYGFIDFLDEIAVHFMTGLLLASLISAFVPADFFIKLGLDEGIFAMLAMVLMGIPMYICSTASIPIAMTLVEKGISMGSGFVYLFTGPVTNIASILILRSVLGKKLTNIYLILVVGCSIFFGLSLDFLLSQFDLNIVYSMSHAHHSHGVHQLHQGVAAIFAVLLTGSFIRKFKKKS